MKKIYFLIFAFLAILSTDLAYSSQIVEEPRASELLYEKASVSLAKNIRFWIDIYTKYSTEEGVIHDAKYINHIYEIIKLNGTQSQNLKTVQQAKRRWKDTLLSIHRKLSYQEPLTPEENRIYLLFSNVHESNKFLEAAHRKRLRYQQGQKEMFLAGLYHSGKYLPMMERIFRKEGLPSVLTRVPFVESSFNVKARSKVGASGIWQFMRSTGRFYLKINNAVDERNDPLAATEAAARLLKLNYSYLGNWALAVTAYNHGRKGIMRAIRRVGADGLDDLIADYRSRSFGFASSNFFAEFMAAVEVEAKAEKYFGKVPRAEPIDFVECVVFDYIEIRQLSRWLSLNLDQIRELNPALTEEVYKGKLLIPSGFRLKIPYSSSLGSREEAFMQFMKRYSEIPKIYKLKGQRYQKYDTRMRTVKRIGF
jgi:membrane-bound lytic murein transglycosylase D